MAGVPDAREPRECVPRESEQESEQESGRWLVYLAAERTLLAWVRAAISLVVLGFAVDRFGLYLAEHGSSALYGTTWSSSVGLGLIGSGVAISVLCAVRYRRFARRYDAGDLQPGSGIRFAIGLCWSLAAVGSVLAAYLWLASA